MANGATKPVECSHSKQLGACLRIPDWATSPCCEQVTFARQQYVNSLRFDIQDQLSLLSLRSVEEAYQVSLKVEEKLMRKQSQKERVRGSGGREQ